MGGKVTKNDTKVTVVKSSTLNTSPTKKYPSHSNNFKDRTSNKKPKIVNKIIENTELNVLNLVRADNENLEDFTLLEGAISANFFLKNLSKESRIEIIKKMQLFCVGEDVFLFKEGTNGNFFYIIQDGLVELTIKDKIIKTMSKGESFGELSLLHDAMRSVTIKTLKKSFFYCIEKKNFRSITNKMNNLNYDENKQFLRSIGILDSLLEDQKHTLISNLNKENYEESNCIIKEGEMGSCLYYIKDGEVKCINKENILIRNLKKGDYFGQQSILLDIPRTMTVVSSTKSTLLSISIETIKNLFGEKYRDILVLNFIKHAFLNSKYFVNLETKYLENILDSFKITKYDKNMIVFKKGNLYNSKLVILIEGNLINVS